MRQSLKYILFYTLVLTFVAKLILPSEFYTQDIVIHIPFIRFFSESNYYAQDYLRQYGSKQTQYTLFYSLLANTIDAQNPEQTYLILQLLHIVYLLFLFSGILFVSQNYFRRLLPGIITICLLLSHIHIGGAAITTIESEFVPRGLATVLLLWAFYFWCSGKKKLVLLLLFISILIHALTAFYGLFLVSFSFFIQQLPSLSKRIYFISILITGIIVFGVLLVLHQEFYDAAWLQVLQLRNSYAFLQLWSFRSWLNLVLLLIPGIVYMSSVLLCKTKLFHDLCVVYFGSILASLLYFFGTTLVPIPQFVAVQIGRIFLFPVFFSFLAFGYFVQRYCAAWAQIIIIYTVLLFAFLMNQRGQFAVAATLKPWLEVQTWARTYTAENCVFLVPFFSAGFRVNSVRSITGEYKDGTLSFYSQDFSKNWFHRYQLLSTWEKLPMEKLLLLQTEFNFDYIVSPGDIKYILPEVYRNQQFVVYNLRKNGFCQHPL